MKIFIKEQSIGCFKLSKTETKEKLSDKLPKTPERETAKTNAEIMKNTFAQWNKMTEEEKAKWRSFKYRCRCPKCGQVNFDNDVTEVIKNIPHLDSCEYLNLGEKTEFNAEIN